MIGVLIGWVLDQVAGPEEPMHGASTTERGRCICGRPWPHPLTEEIQ